MLSLDIWSYVRSTHVHHTWQSAVTLWCAWISLCNHSLYCSEECALKNCLSWLHPRFSHYVSAELGFTTIFLGRLYWHPHSHGQRWFQDNKSLPRWFGFWKEMERERAHTVGEPLSSRPNHKTAVTLMDDHVESGRPPLLVLCSDPFPVYAKGKRLESLWSGWWLLMGKGFTFSSASFSLFSIVSTNQSGCNNKERTLRLTLSSALRTCFWDLFLLLGCLVQPWREVCAWPDGILLCCV